MTQTRDLPFRTSRSGFPARGAGARGAMREGPLGSWPFGSVSFPVASGLTELKHGLLGGTEGAHPAGPLVSITPGEVCAETTRNPDLGRDPEPSAACLCPGLLCAGGAWQKRSWAAHGWPRRSGLKSAGSGCHSKHHGLGGSPRGRLFISRSLGAGSPRSRCRPISIQARVLSPARGRPPSYCVPTC